MVRCQTANAMAREAGMASWLPWGLGNRGSPPRPADPVDDAAPSLEGQILLRVDEDGDGGAGHAQVAGGPSPRPLAAVANPSVNIPSRREAKSREKLGQ